MSCHSHKHLVLSITGPFALGYSQTIQQLLIITTLDIFADEEPFLYFFLLSVQTATTHLN